MSTLYYYCNNITFSGIIHKKELWLSDMNYSNDYAEIIGFANPLVKAFEENIYEVEVSLKKYGYEPDSTIKKLNQLYKEKLTSKLKSLYCLAICFSKSRDDLSQWRAYGDNGCGVAIGFNEDCIRNLSENHKLLVYMDICYSETKKLKIINDYTKNVIQEIKANVIKNKGKKDLFTKKGPFPHLFSQRLDEILKVAPSYKNNDFSAENEVRLAYIRTIFPEQFSDLSSESYLNKLDCRVSSNKIIPYLTLPIDEYANAIDEIIIGPCNVTTKETLGIFLARHGVSVGEISESVVSFRIK